MRVKHKPVLAVSALVIVSGLFWFTFHILKEFNKISQQIGYDSNMSFLNAVISERLDEYYDTHGQYPAKLTDLTNAILAHCYKSEIPENPKELGILDKFLYSTNGTYYEITWDAQWGKGELYTYKEHALKGKITFTEMYIDGQLYSRDEFEDGHIYPFTGVKKTYRNGKLIQKTIYRDGEVVSEEKYSD